MVRVQLRVILCRRTSHIWWSCTLGQNSRRSFASLARSHIFARDNISVKRSTLNRSCSSPFKAFYSTELSLNSSGNSSSILTPQFRPANTDAKAPLSNSTPGSQSQDVLPSSSYNSPPDFIDSIINRLRKSASAKSFAAPFTDLNTEDRTIISELIDDLSQSLHCADHADGIPITAVDFFNPAIGKAYPVMKRIYDGELPLNLLEFFKQTRDDLAELVLIKLLNKLYIAHRIRSLPPVDHSIDFNTPAEWFPEARRMRRKVIMHVGPTNSGKTYRLLQKLAAAESGYYAGPLRLLAREIFERFNQQENIRCNLITGEEVIPMIDDFGKVSGISLGTIEMIPLFKQLDVCVIDEIQMISDEFRGLAWTSALLGVLAKEIHLCGEASAVPLVKRILETTGDELTVNHYDRMGQLTIESKPVSGVRGLRKGDCVVAFSKRKILDLKCAIELKSKYRVGIIYGALPPEIRLEEAQRFNSGKYDILVASDAVGMGLNLKIRRIVFSTTQKFNGTSLQILTPLEMKQIAGRAGRYLKDAGELEGFVLAMSLRDLNAVRRQMETEIAPLEKARLWPTPSVWKAYTSKFRGGTPFSTMLEQFEKETLRSNGLSESSIYSINEVTDRFETLRLLLREDLYRHTTLDDQLILSLAPINVAVALPQVLETAIRFFSSIAHTQTNTIFDFNFLHEKVIAQPSSSSSSMQEAVETLQLLEDNHRQILLFMWLSQRWPTLFVDRESALDMKSLIEKRIAQELLNLRRVNSDRRSG